MDLRDDPRTAAWRTSLNLPPEKDEIVKEMRKMKDSAPGENGARIRYILQAGEETEKVVVELVQFMWKNGADSWEETLKRGLIVPMFKKGDRNDPNNYRGVCLLSMGRRIVARIVSTRLTKWAEDMQLLDDDQSGFRSGRSTADATQVMMRLQEDGIDLKKRGGAQQDGFVPAARLLDLKKAYPRVNKAALWMLLRRYGLEGDFLRLLQDLHESTEYVVRGKEGNSEPWVPERGLTEGCPSSPGLFNIYHQAVMRVAKKEREIKAAENGNGVAGIVMKWVPGSAFPDRNKWEKKNCSEAVPVVVEKSLFADDTTAVGNQEELNVGIEVIKEVMGRFEERNNDNKEEALVFGDVDSGKVRMLGTWLGWKEGVDNRIARAGRAWFAVRGRLIGSRLSKKKQARIVETCVENALLFDCQVRVWQVREMNRLQKFMDRVWRYIWSRKTKPPLIQMEEEKKNMWDVRRELGVSSVRWKIEKRVLERIGHVMRMGDDRMVKACILGWMEELENFEKPSGGSRKTILYWKKLMREAGLDPTNVAGLTKDRKRWKELTKERTRHLAEWEKSKGHGGTGSAVERNIKRTEEFVFICDVCPRVCKSKTGLVNHRRRMHEESTEKKKFKCEKCMNEYKKESELINHRKVCGGAVASVAGRVRCACGKEYSKSYHRKHRANCAAWQGQSVEVAAPAAARAPCPKCARVMRKDNLARHIREACPG